MNPSFGVIVPMFNEKSGAKKCIAEITHSLNQADWMYKIIAVDDGSSDGTLDILNSLLEVNQNLVVIIHERNQGYGGAIKTGIKKAHDLGLDYVLFMDSDLTNKPTDIMYFYKKMQLGVDVIKATRYSEGGKIEGVPLKRRIISRVGNIIACRLFKLPITDPTNGFRALRTNIVSRLDFKEKGFPIIVEEIYLLANMRLTYGNIPVTLSNRSSEGRGSSFSYTPAQLFNYLKYPLMTYFGIQRN